MENLIEKIKEKEDLGAMVVSPASDEDINWCQNELLECDLAILPKDYISFLKFCNGFAFNGVEIFGTDIVEDTETGFSLIDIVSFSEEQNEYFETELLYFGRVDDDVFAFDPKIKKYQIRDITSMDVLAEHDLFIDFLEKEIIACYF